MRANLLRLLASPWIIASVALLLRVLYLVYRAHLIPAEVLASAPFENEVGNVAAALVQGRGFCCVFRQPTGPTAWIAPAYPLLLAAVFKLFGAFTITSFYAAVLLNCVFSALVCLPLFRTAQRIANPAVAVLAAWLWAVFPNGIILPYAWIWDTSLSALLAALLLERTLRLPDSRAASAYLAYGLLWALALLTNPSLGAVLPLLFAWVFFRDANPVPARLRGLSLTLAVIFLCCLPWTVRNYVQFHRFVPIRSNFAYEFWSGNNEIFDPDSRAVNRVTRYEQARLYGTFGETAFFDDKWQKAANFVHSNPRLYFQLSIQRVIATWFGTATPWRNLREAGSFLARFLIITNVLTFLGTLAGLIRLAVCRSPYLVPLASFPLCFPVAFYLTHTTLRHRHPCDPVLLLLVAIALAIPRKPPK